VAAPAEAASAVDLDAISDEDIERLLGSGIDSKQNETIEGAKR
jgi:hypothetical protein